MFSYQSSTLSVMPFSAFVCQTGVFCWAGETSSHSVGVWRRCAECAASLPQTPPASSACAWLPRSHRDPSSSCQVQSVRLTKIINTLTKWFNVHYLSEWHYSTQKGSAGVHVFVWRDGWQQHITTHSPGPGQIDGREDHVPCAHKALPLRYPLISVQCDGEPDQWVYFGKRVGGDCSASYQDSVELCQAEDISFLKNPSSWKRLARLC